MIDYICEIVFFGFCVCCIGFSWGYVDFFLSDDWVGFDIGVGGKSKREVID